MVFYNPFAILLCIFARALAPNVCVWYRHPSSLSCSFLRLYGNYRICCLICVMYEWRATMSACMVSEWVRFGGYGIRNKWKDRKINIEKCASPEYQMKTNETYPLLPYAEENAFAFAPFFTFFCRIFCHLMREHKVKNNNNGGNNKVMGGSIIILRILYRFSLPHVIVQCRSYWLLTH